ncbi:hypothetical protein B0A52_08383 [Exophiala mesophila]|uniref:DNA repair protein Rad26 n=1 Tax=Exophiala mesophila TaxID=212818 RepID=A0A438MXX9_EXOME|nr:hypothetical protein B0A52_08383 [Exophiala mesophila]
MNGMDDNDGEQDLFDDDNDFDDIPEAALQELEHNALLSTQQSRKPNTLAPPVRPQFNIQSHRLSSSVHQHLPQNVPDDDSFEYIADDDLATPVEEHASFNLKHHVPRESASRETFRQHRYGQAQFHAGPPARTQPGQNIIPLQPQAPSDGRFYGFPAKPLPAGSIQPSLQDHSVPETNDPHVLRAQIQALIKDNSILTTDLRQAKDAALTQNGEISIIRSKLEKETKVFDRQIGSLKKTMQDEAAKYKAAVDALTEKNRQLSTRFQFLEQEHAQGMQETKSLKQRLRDQPSTEQHDGISTPKHGMGASLRDGFDDDDIMLQSPSKSARRSKPATPTVANKRKRKLDGPSPVKGLTLRLSGRASDEIQPRPPPSALPEERPAIIVRKDPQAERNLRFLQLILDFHPRAKHETLLENLVQYAFPSDHNKRFSTILLDGVAKLNGDRLPADLLQIFVDMWAQSLKEQFYKPISLFIEVVGFIVDHNMASLDTGIVNSLVPVVQNSIAINARKRFEHSPVYHSSFGTIRQTPQAVLKHDVNSTSCLDLLLTMSYVVKDDPALTDLFWRLMDPEFILMMLNAWQPISDITLMLQLLATSICPSTFGPISTSDQQTKIEHWIINRVCCLLWETPQVDEGLPPNTADQLCHLRLEVLDLLTALAITSSPYPHDDPNYHGSLLLANDTHAIARIVRSLFDEVSSMYLLTPSHVLHSELVNRGVRVLYHVLQTHSQTINLQEKLSVINGGVHKHRVVLTRLAFSEGFYIDRHITDETVAMATGLLEESVTPDEADELIEAFPGFKGRGSTSEMRGEIGDDPEDEMEVIEGG